MKRGSRCAMFLISMIYCKSARSVLINSNGWIRISKIFGIPGDFIFYALLQCQPRLIRNLGFGITDIVVEFGRVDLCIGYRGHLVNPNALSTENEVSKFLLLIFDSKPEVRILFSNYARPAHDRAS